MVVGQRLASSGRVGRRLARSGEVGELSGRLLVLLAGLVGDGTCGRETHGVNKHEFEKKSS